FQDGILLVPQRERETDPLMAIADARDAVFVPAIGARSRVVVREVPPGVAVRAVVFANRAPGTFAEIRTPTLPVGLTQARFLEAPFFDRHHPMLGAYTSPLATLPQAVLLDLDDTILDDSGTTSSCWLEACRAHSSALDGLDPVLAFEAIERVREWY